MQEACASQVQHSGTLGACPCSGFFGYDSILRSRGTGVEVVSGDVMLISNGEGGRWRVDVFKLLLHQNIRG